ncbi:hypothetical protein ACHAWF_008032 [Thalassiosira exigua]
MRSNSAPRRLTSLSLIFAVVSMISQKSFGKKHLHPLPSWDCASFVHLSAHGPAAGAFASGGRPYQNYNDRPDASKTRRLSSPSSSSSSQPTSTSPWSSGKWKINLDFGRNEQPQETNEDVSKLLGKEWGTNGGRLVISFEILANANARTNAEADTPIQMAWLGGKPTDTVECIPQTTDNGEEYCASYINTSGQQLVQISPGQWRVEPPLPLLPSYTKALPGQASTLRFSLSLLTSVERNSISLPKDQLLLFTSNAFRKGQYSDGIQTLLPYQYDKEQSQMVLEKQLNHETGDRRLDGNDLLETLGGYKDMADLIVERDDKRRKWREIEAVLPKLDTDIPRRVEIDKSVLEDDARWGLWPGDTEFMTIERGVIVAVVANENKKTGMFPWLADNVSEESVIVGKWSAIPC